MSASARRNGAVIPCSRYGPSNYVFRSRHGRRSAPITSLAAEKSGRRRFARHWRNTCSNALVVLCGSDCWHRPTSRSTSAGSVTSVSVSAPVGVIDTSTSLLPTRSNWATLPCSERHAAEHAHHVARKCSRRFSRVPRRNSQAQIRNIRSRSPSAATVVVHRIPTRQPKLASSSRCGGTCRLICGSGWRRSLGGARRRCGRRSAWRCRLAWTAS